MGKLYCNGDKPAAIHANGTQEWWMNGQLHRDGDKPAIIAPDGTMQWCKNGIPYQK
jgi:predicted lipoprotein with Yx(FWY)xxD motif